MPFAEFKDWVNSGAPKREMTEKVAEKHDATETPKEEAIASAETAPPKVEEAPSVIPVIPSVIPPGFEVEREEDGHGNPIFQKGERVAIQGDAGEGTGRHGEVVEAHSLTFRPIFGGTETKPTYHYVVRTDQGTLIHASKLQPEVGERPAHVPDPIHQGHPIMPQALRRLIDLDRQNAARDRAAATRARKPENKRTLLAEAKRSEEEANAKQGTLDQWKADNPEEAARIFPEPTKTPAKPKAPLELAETRHAKKGIPLFVARLTSRVADHEFKRLRQDAEAAGGYWSAFKGSGAIPGFQFEDKAKAEKFIADHGQEAQRPATETQRPATPPQQAPEKPQQRVVGTGRGTNLWTEIGDNYRGEPVWQDHNGVRSYTTDDDRSSMGGFNIVRHTEPVRMIPGRGGLVPSAPVPEQKPDEYKVAKPHPAAVGQAIEYREPEPSQAPQVAAPFDHEQWWNKSLNPHGRRIVADLAGVPHNWALAYWHNIPSDVQQRLAGKKVLAEERFETIRPPGAPPEQPSTQGPSAGSEPPKTGYGASNKTFTAEAAERARAILREKLNRLNAGLDPEAMLAGLTLAGYHIEAGARAFADYAKAMVADMGEGVRPFLRGWYENVRYHPGFDARGMTPAAEILPEAEQPPISTPETDHGLQGPVPAGNEGAGPAHVEPTLKGGETRRAPSGEEPGGARDVAQPPGAGAEGGERETTQPGGAGPGGEGSAGNSDRVPSTGEGPAPRAPRRLAAPEATGLNFRIQPGELAESRGPALKARDNIAAIELAKQLTVDKQLATREQQQILAKYVGWGGLSGAFRNPQTGQFAKGLEEVGRRLQEVLDRQEYGTASRSTQYAHYTSEGIIDAMWGAMRHMGFAGGSVFEPGMGVGHFLGLMPDDMAAKSSYRGVEMDRISAQIASLLYPEAGVRMADFTRVALPPNEFDMVIGNPPFSDTVITSDPRYKDKGFVLHDYFFAKSLDSVRPGGLLGFVTSAVTMNKMDDSARLYMAARGEFLGGVRLPSSAFAGNAGTEVTTDILFFKKRPATIDPASLPPTERAWTETVERTLPGVDGDTRGRVSRYFTENPSQVLGREGFFDNLYKGRYAVHDDGRDAEGAIREALGRLPRDVMEPEQTPDQKAARDLDATEKKDGSFYLKNGVLYQYSGGAGTQVQRRSKDTPGLTGPEHERVRHLVPIRDALRDVLRHDLAGNAEEATRARVDLNKHYDAFVSKFGPINKADITRRRPSRVEMESARLEARGEARSIGAHWDDGTFDPSGFLSKNAKLHEIAAAREAARDAALAAGRPWEEGTFDPEDMPDTVIIKRPNLKPFRTDPESYRLSSIEDYDDDTGQGRKKEIFTRSVIRKPEPPQINSAQDGVLWSLNEFGRFDLGKIAEKMGKPPSDILIHLGDLVFRVPGTGDVHQVREEYLTGDVKTKLEEARAAALHDAQYERNVKALEAVQPQPLAPSLIEMSVGMPWIPTDVVQAFARDYLDIGNVIVSHIAAVGKWVVAEAPAERWTMSKNEGKLRYGTDRMDAHEILQAAMNRIPARIYDKLDDGSRVLNGTATLAANDKIQTVKDEFGNWLRKEPETHERLADLYNEKLNRVIERTFDGSYLTTPGLADGWKWRPHQTSVISRIVQTGNTYVAHAVGAGKTSAMIGSGMEMRRLGMIRKPMYTVPKNMLGQFTKEFYEQYPLAQIRVADEEAFHTHRRRQFVANVAQDDIDAVIITHPAFGMIPISPDFEDGLIEEQIEAFRVGLEAAKKSGEAHHTIKRLGKAIEKLEERLRSNRAGRKDLTNTFEELGVDFLFVDEAHLFRKLAFGTAQSSLKGVDPEGSDMAWDLFTKVRFLDSQRPGRSAVFASGTPVTNTMGELYTVSRYMQPNALASRGLSHFDSWAQACGDTKQISEPRADGSYKPVTRFSRFVNLPELYKMVTEVMDIVTSNELAQYVVRPSLKGGERALHLAPFTDNLKAYQQELAGRIAAIEARRGPPKPDDDIILSVINDGRHAAIDPRFVMDVPNDPESKLNMMIDRVYRTWVETTDHQFYDPATNYETPAFRGPATQLVFSNLGVNERGPQHFSGYAWIKAALKAKGIPPNEIAFIGDYKTAIAKQNLFNEVNDGKVRIIIGSTQKMGVGMNVQRRLYAVHNVDPLWYPSDDEQRNGRALRQGNYNREIELNDYGTTDTYDRTMWGMMARKGRFIEQFFRGDPTLRTMEDVGEAGAFEQAAAMATSDPRILQLTEMRQELETQRRRRDAHDSEQYGLRSRARDEANRVQYYQGEEDAYQEDIEKRIPTRGDAFRMTVGGGEFDKRKEAGEALGPAIFDALTGMAAGNVRRIGTIGGFPIQVRKIPKGGYSDYALELVLSRGRTYDIQGTGAEGHIASAEHAIASLEDYQTSARLTAEKALKAQQDAERLVGKPFEGQSRLNELEEKVTALEAELAAPPAAPSLREPIKGEIKPGKEVSAPDLKRAAANAMRAAGLPATVGVRFVDRIAGGKANAQYLRALVTMALDTPPDQMPAKLFHEMAHAIMDPALNILSSEQREALRLAADRYLKDPDRRGELEFLYGSDPGVLREEAIASLAEQAMERSRIVPSVARRAADAMQRTFTGLRQMMQGHGFTTADDVFRAMMQGKLPAGVPPVRPPTEAPKPKAAPEAETKPDLLRTDLAVATVAPPTLTRTEKQRYALQAHAFAHPIPQGVVRGAIDELQRWFSPTSRPGARLMELVIRKHSGEQARSLSQAVEALDHVRQWMDRLPKDAQLDFTDRYESGQAQPTRELQAIADSLRLLFELQVRMTRSLGRGYLSATIENYQPHIWRNYAEWKAGLTEKNAAKGHGSAAASIYGKRPIQGSGAFLKQRTFDTQREGMAAGLIPVTTNPIDMAILKLAEMQKFYHGTRMADHIKEGGLARWVPWNLEHYAKASGMKTLDDKIFNPILPPATAQHFEAFDPAVRKGLQAVADYLGVRLKRPLNDATMRLHDAAGYSKGDLIAARFGGFDGVLMHEVGHQIDDRYGLGTALLGDPIVADELRQLAEARLPQNASQEARDYVTSPREAVANLLHGYWHAPALVADMAPNALRSFEEFLDLHKDLGDKVRAVRPSVKVSKTTVDQFFPGLRHLGAWYAPEPVATVFNNYVSRGLAGKSSIYDAARLLSNAINMAQLSLSGFHATFVSIDTAVSRLALGVQQASRAEFGEAAKSVALTPFSPVMTPIRGARLLAAYRDQAKGTPELQRIAQMMAQVGGRATMDRIYGGAAGGPFFKSLADLQRLITDLPGTATAMKNGLAEMWGNTPGPIPLKALAVALKIASRTLETLSHPLMGILVPAAKAGVFRDMAEDWLRRNPNASEEEMREALTKSWDSVDNRLGELVHDNLFWHRTMKDSGVLLMRAQSWNLGSIREIAGGLGVDPVKVANDIARGHYQGITQRMGYVLAAPIIYGLIGGIMTYLFTGEAPKDLVDLFFPRDGTLDAHGKPNRRNLPGYIKDVVDLYHDPLRTAGNKANPLLSLVTQVATNKDYQGFTIYSPQHDEIAEAYGKYLLKQVTPIGMRTQPNQQPLLGSPMLDAASRFWGLTNAPGFIINPEREAMFKARAEKQGYMARERYDARH
jgi:N12 class adenine-specific DNA methylase